MKVSINGSIQNIKVTVVTLEADPEHPNEMQLWRCPKDGEIVTQFIGMGGDQSIVPGPGIVQLGQLGFCKKCKRRYLFNSFVWYTIQVC